MPQRIADELDTFSGNRFLVRSFDADRAEPIQLSTRFKIVRPAPEDVREILLEMERENWEEAEETNRANTFDDYLQTSNVNQEIYEYISNYCFPDLPLKIPA